MSTITPLIVAAESGDQAALSQLFEIVYKDLRYLACTRLARESSGNTLQPTALVNEVYIRMFGPRKDGTDRLAIEWKNRGHFFAAAAKAMRRILVEAARSKLREKRGGGKSRELMDLESIAAPHLAEDLLALDEAIVSLESMDSRIARFVSLRYFAGLTNLEAAETMGISERTGNSYWQYARSWLLAEIRRTTDRHD